MPISLATLSTIALRSLANSLRSATSSSVALPMAFGSDWTVAERAQLNVLGRELVPQRRGLVGEFLHDGIVLRFLFLRERLVNAVLIRPLLSPVTVVTVVGRCQRLPGNPAYREESGKGYGDRGFIELIEVLLKGVLFVTLA